MMTIKNMQKFFDGADRSITWKTVFGDHSVASDFYYNVFYVCPQDKIVEIELSGIFVRVADLEENFQEGWLSVIPAATATDYWIGNWSRRRIDPANTIVRLTRASDTSGGSSFWPSLSDTRIQVGVEKIKLLPGDVLVAYVKTNDQWGTELYTDGALENCFSLNCVVYEEDFAGPVAEPNIGDEIFGYINGATTTTIYIKGNLTTTYTNGASILIQNSSSSDPALERTVNSAPVYLTTQDLTQIELSGAKFSSGYVTDREGHFGVQINSVVASGGNTRYNTAVSPDIRFDAGERILIESPTLKSSYPTTVKTVDTTSVTTYDPFVYGVIPLYSCNIKLSD